MMPGEQLACHRPCPSLARLWEDHLWEDHPSSVGHPPLEDHPSSEGRPRLEERPSGDLPSSGDRRPWAAHQLEGHPFHHVVHQWEGVAKVGWSVGLLQWEVPCHSQDSKP